MDTAEIDLRRYIEVIWKWRLVIVLLTGAAVAASAVFSFFVLSPVYETRVTLLVANATQTQQSTSQASSSVADTVSRIPTMTLNTYMSQITSPYFLSRVVSKLGTPGLSADSLNGMVSAQVLKDTNLVEVRVQNTDKAAAAKIANTMASEFVQFVSDQNQERMSKSLAFLAEQETAVKQDLADAYKTLNAVQTKPDSAAALSRQLASVNDVIVRLKQELAQQQITIDILRTELRQIDGEIARTPETIPGPGGTANVPNPAHESLDVARASKDREISDTNAQIIAMSSQIADLERQAGALDAKYAAAQNEETVAQANVTRLESTLNLLSSKIVEAQMAHSVNLGETNIAVVSPALEPSSPVKPRKMVNMAVAGVLGGFVSVLLVFVLEYMDNTVKTQEDVAKFLNLGTLGAIPVMEGRVKRKK